MKRIGLIVQMVLALCVLGMASSSIVVAEEGLLPQQGEKEGPTSEGGAVTFETLEKETISCGGWLILRPRFLPGSNVHGTAEFHLIKCTTLGLPTNTLGDGSGVILLRELFLLCLVRPKELGFGVLLQPEETVHLEVPAAKILLLTKGAVIAENSSGNSGKEFKFVLEGKGGDQSKALECEINGKTFKHSFELGVDTKADSMASATATYVFKFSEEVQLMDT